MQKLVFASRFRIRRIPITLLRVFRLSLAWSLVVLSVQIAQAGPNDVFVGASKQNAIFRFKPDGTQTTFATGITPLAMVFDASGNLIADDGFGLKKYTPTGGLAIIIPNLKSNDTDNRAWKRFVDDRAIVVAKETAISATN